MFGGGEFGCLVGGDLLGGWLVDSADGAFGEVAPVGGFVVVIRTCSPS
jgi:hypothetical protein